ncbi:MAG: hypothetical protein RQ801_02865 [Spirochaetaceae bacterium]|nr:hypothetical protein [Spirochaetaceae bacterium]MDT8297216.1 hypothetical protein [Spirochaetaceae bacterium]
MPISYTWISDDDQLKKLSRKLLDREDRLLAIDFEGEFNLHVYGERLCLIQLFDGKDYYLIDPFPMDDAVLAEFLTLKNKIYMFYSADSDISLIYKQYKVKMNGIYDLQHLVEVLDLPKKGLDAVLEAELGIRVEGKKRYQMHNWMTRPIEEGAKQYALGDVAHLFALHETLLNKVKQSDKVEDLILKIAGNFKDFDKKSVPGIFKTTAYRKMSSKKKKLYETIVAVRESCAEELDVPAHLVIPKQELVSLTEDTGRIRSLRFHQKVPRSMQERIIKEISRL